MPKSMILSNQCSFQISQIYGLKRWQKWCNSATACCDEELSQSEIGSRMPARPGIVPQALTQVTKQRRPPAGVMDCLAVTSPGQSPMPI
ncbi:hypothetical protein Ddc_12986 [Ditylenchus destructor]|nr:hypothetical protein Ddc_12986 [Ditylenchus destructor]